MIEVSNLATQTLQPGQSITFDKVLLRTTCGSECYNPQVPTSIKLGAKGIYELHFNGNITSDTAGTAVQLAMTIGGTPLVETAMNATIATANALANVSTSTLLRNCCCDLDRVSVTNVGTTPVTVAQNANFYIVRKS